MNREGCKGLGSSLREADIGKSFLIVGCKNVIDGVRDVVESELIDRVVSKGGTCGRMVNILLRIFITTVVAKPDIVSLVDKNKR